MDNLTWYKGKRLRERIDATMGGLTTEHLAVVMILAARDSNKSLEDIVQELILAQGFAPAPTDKEEIKRQLGF